MIRSTALCRQDSAVPEMQSTYSLSINKLGIIPSDCSMDEERGVRHPSAEQHPLFRATGCNNFNPANFRFCFMLEMQQ